MSRWIHMPRYSEEYEYYKFLCGNYEAYASHQLGVLLCDSYEDGVKTAITYFKKGSFNL